MLSEKFSLLNIDDYKERNSNTDSILTAISKRIISVKYEATKQAKNEH